MLRIVLIFAFLGAFATAGKAETGVSLNKPSFYDRYPIGTLGIVKRAKTRLQAANRRKYLVFSDAECHEVPDWKNKVWFVVNHRDVQKANSKSFFSVRIIYHNSGDQDFLHLYRNRNWHGDNDQVIEKDFSSDSNRISISANEFIDLHSVVGVAEDAVESKKLALLDKIGSPFHASISSGGMNSWDHAYLAGKPFLKDYAPKLGRLSVRHIRFTVTSKLNSQHPVLFDAHGHGADAVTIFVDAPDILTSGSGIKQTFMLNGNKCE